MKRNSAVAMLLAATLALVLMACGGGAYNNDDPTTTTQTITEPEDILVLSPVFVNGENVADAQVLRDEDYFVTHLELMPVVQAMGLEHSWDETTGEVRIHELAGGDDAVVVFVAGEEHDSVLVDGALFVPISFVRTALGVPGVAVMSGEVHISTHTVEDDMS